MDRGHFTPRLVRVMELAPREASRVGHDGVGPEHLLLGLAREANSVAVHMLSALGVSPADVRREVTRRFHNLSRPSPGDSARDAGSRERPARATLDYASRTKAVEDAPPMTFRALVEALGVHVRCGVSEEERALPQALLVDLQYAYEVRAADDVSGVVDYGALMEEAARALEREEFRLLETKVRRVGRSR